MATLAARKLGVKRRAAEEDDIAPPQKQAAPEAEDIYVFKEPVSTKPPRKDSAAAPKRPRPTVPEVGPDGQPLSRGQQRKHAVQERRLHKKGGEVIADLRTRWEKLRVKHMDKSERNALIDSAMETIKGNVHDIIFKHDASRVVQSCIKYGTPEHRASIVAELNGHFLELVRSPYGKFIVAKVFKFIPSARSMVIAELRGHYVALLRHAESSGLIDEVFCLYARSQERAAMLREFGGAEFSLFRGETEETLSEYLVKNPSKRDVVLLNLRENLQDLLNKGSGRLQMVHALLHEYLLSLASPKDRDDFHADVCDHVAELIHTRKGAEVAMACFLHGSAKDRKVMLKALKEPVLKVAQDEHGYLVLIRALDVVDDTVLLHKSITAELLKDAVAVLSHKFARRPLVHILAGRSRHYLHPANYALLESSDATRALTSKKDPDVRRNELLDLVSPALIKTVQEHAEELLNGAESSEMVCEILLHARGRAEAFDAVAELVAVPYGPDHPIDRIFLNRALKRVVVDEWKRKEDVAQDGALFAPVLLNKLRGRLASYLASYGGFVILALLESPVTAADAEAELKMSQKQIASMSSQAAKIVARKLAGEGSNANGKRPAEGKPSSDNAKKAKTDATETKTPAKVGTKADAKTPAKPETKTPAKTESKTPAKAEITADARTPAKVETPAEVEPKTPAKIDGKAHAKAVTPAKASTPSKVEAETKPDAKTPAKADAGTQAKTPAKAPTKTPAKADAEKSLKIESKTPTNVPTKAETPSKPASPAVTPAKVTSDTTAPTTSQKAKGEGKSVKFADELVAAETPARTAKKPAPIMTPTPARSSSRARTPAKIFSPSDYTK